MAVYATLEWNFCRTPYYVGLRVEWIFYEPIFPPREKGLINQFMSGALIRGVGLFDIWRMESGCSVTYGQKMLNIN